MYVCVEHTHTKYMYLLLVKSLEGCFAVKVFINHEKTKIMIQFVVSSYVLNFIFRKAFFLSPEICKLDKFILSSVWSTTLLC